MILSRLASFILRFGEFICAMVVLGIAAHLIHVHDPALARNSYSLAIAVLSSLISLLWLIPSTSAMLHFAGDVFLAAAWFAAFGIDVNWTTKHNHCSSGAFRWRGAFHGGRCGEWKAMEAFSFVAACFWVASAVLSMWVGRRVERRGNTSRV